MPHSSVNGAQLWYKVHGDGPPLVLLPGLGLDHRYYRFGEPLLREVATTVLLDPRGIGQSEKTPPTDVIYCAELWADDTAELCRALGHDKVDVLGSSLGGSMAQALALRHPELVRSLIVVGAFSEVDRAMIINFELRKKIIAKLGMGEEIADFMGLFTMTREFIETDDGFAIMQANKASVSANPPELYAAFIDAVLHWGRVLPGQEDARVPTDLIGQIACPTLCIAGDNDHFIPASFTKRIAATIPGAQYAEVESGGHIPFIEKPHETAEIVKGFLRGL